MIKFMLPIPAPMQTAGFDDMPRVECPVVIAHRNLTPSEQLMSKIPPRRGKYADYLRKRFQAKKTKALNAV